MASSDIFFLKNEEAKISVGYRRREKFSKIFRKSVELCYTEIFINFGTISL